MNLQILTQSLNLNLASIFYTNGTVSVLVRPL